MRDIIFRGKQTDKDKWVYGVPTKGNRYDESEILMIERVFDCDEYACKGCEFAPVIPETVGQYTGLTDKNGKKIFEGDVLKEEYEVFVSARKKEKRTRIGYVEYSACDLCNGYYAYFWNDKEKWRGNFGIHHCCEVIGNIHDNPELIWGWGRCVRG